MPIRPAPARRRGASCAAVALLSVLALVGASACDITLGSPPDAMESFVEAVNEGDVQRAASFTDDPAAARQALAAGFEGMQGATAHLSVIESLRGTLTTHTAWTLPNGAKTETTGTIERLENGKVPWSQHILDSRLMPGGRLVYSQDLDYASPVIGRDRNTLMSWQTVTVVSIAADAPDADVRALADLLHGADPSITPESVYEGMSDAAAQDGDGGSSTVITLRAADADPLRGRLAAIPSVTAADQGRLLTADPKLASPALDGVPEMWHDVLAKSAGWSVDIDNPGDEHDVRVQAVTPEDVQNVPITMDSDTQLAAQGAVDASNLPAAIVAIDPSDGGILAVAQNAAATGRGPVALSGLYSPGAAFTPITAAAALGSGVARPQDPVDCPAQVAVDGRTVDNPGDLALDTVPLSTAVAAGCSTSLALLSGSLDTGELADTAEALGLGADFETPGLTTTTGGMTDTDPGPARVEAAIGQGDVVASPFGMAVAAASLANKGKRVEPMLFTGMPGTADDPPAEVSEHTASAVHTIMRTAVTEGSAAALRDVDGLAGVAGTSESAGRPGHGWFLGMRDGMAFAVFIQNADSATPATDMAGAFLHAVSDAS